MFAPLKRGLGPLNMRSNPWDLEVLRSQDLSFWDPSDPGPLQIWGRTPNDPIWDPKWTPFGTPLWTPKMALLQLPRVATRAS